MNLIELQHYTKKFSHKIVFSNFNLKIDTGEMVAVMGPSGSGKTTLLNALGLIDDVDDGTYHLFGKPAPKSNTKRANKTIRNHISYLFQNFALVDNFTVSENLMMALRYAKFSKPEKKALIHEALTKVGLPNYEKLKIFEISGGEQQRVSIARAMIKPSSLILADEPTGALDIENRNEILHILHAINKQGKTMVIVTHDPKVAQSCDRIIHLDQN